MRSTEDIVSHVLTLAKKVPSLRNNDLIDITRETEQLGEILGAFAESCFSGTPTVDRIRTGAHSSRATIEITLAAKAFDTARQAVHSASGVSKRIVEITSRLAENGILAALESLRHIAPEALDGDQVTQQSAPPASDNISEQTGDLSSDHSVLHNIAAYHREHERYYTREMTEGALYLYRAANQLHVVAQSWRSGRSVPHAPGVDFESSQYSAVGCVDLNSLEAISTIGILFMEGELEPAELRGLKGRLKAVTTELNQAGYWLSEKTDAAWLREQSLFTPELIELAEVRFNTISTNWRGSREMQLAARLLSLAITTIESIDFRPAAIRAHREIFAARLNDAAWVITMAGQLQARTGAWLADNDSNWASYLAGLEAIAR